MGLLNASISGPARGHFEGIPHPSSEDQLARSAMSLKTVAAVLTVDDLRRSQRQVSTQNDDWHSRQRAQEAERVTDAQVRIGEMLKSIPITRTGINPEMQSLAQEITKISPISLLRGIEDRDWKTETKAGLKALVKDDLYREYEKCLRQRKAAIAARAFLTNLEASLKFSDIR
jgi:hypothetical protein